LCACNKAAAAFEKGGFISAWSFNTKQPRGHKQQSRSFNKKAAIRTRLHCARTTKPQRLSKNTALLQHGLSTQNNREVTKLKAALSTKKPRSVPGFIARVQQNRSGFRKTWLYFSAAFQHEITKRPQCTKPLFQQESRDPHQASLHAHNKEQSRSGFRKTRLYFSAVFQHKRTERSQTTKPLFQRKKPRPAPGFIARA
jgi:hypothetical protein